jgi:hypothetical protein
MKNKLSTLAVAAIFSLATVSANAAQTVNFNGVDYQLTKETISYDGNASRFQANPWWGNESLATSLASLYHPDSGYAYFAYEVHPTWVRSKYYEQDLFLQGTYVANLSIPNTVNGYVFGTAVTPVPEADTSAMLLMGAGVMGFMARRRKQVAA